jgi:hypothetical protein
MVGACSLAVNVFPSDATGTLPSVTIAASIFLIALGAILRYATNFSVEGIEIDTVGLILMIAGAAGLVLSFLQEAIWSERAKRRSVAYEEPVARERVVEPPPRDPRY